VYDRGDLAGERGYIEAAKHQMSQLTWHTLIGDRAVDYDWFSGVGLPAHGEPGTALRAVAMERGLAEAIRDSGATRVLTGMGAELCGQEGNRAYMADLVRGGRLFAALREARTWAACSSSSPWEILSRALSTMRPMWPSLLGGSRRWQHTGLFAVAPWIRPDYARRSHLRERIDAIRRRLNRIPMETSSQQLALESFAGDWSSWYLTGPNGIRTCQPFLDPRVISFLWDLPRDFKERPGESKCLLRAAMRGILPERIRVRRRKCGFDQQYFAGLSKNLPSLERLILDSPHAHEMFDTRVLIKALREHAMGLGNVMAGSRLTTTLTLIAWLEALPQWHRCNAGPSDAVESGVALRTCNPCYSRPYGMRQGADSI
jgi:asparagine synthase (glutamine-hydrolysing)